MAVFVTIVEAGSLSAAGRTLRPLKLIVAGHRTLCFTRIRGWFWRRLYCAPLLLIATFDTKILETRVAV